jgi:hypothetical protein
MQSFTTCSHIEVDSTLPQAIDSGENDRSKTMNGVQERIEDFGGGHVGFFDAPMIWIRPFVQLRDFGDLEAFPSTAFLPFGRLDPPSVAIVDRSSG